MVARAAARQPGGPVIATTNSPTPSTTPAPRSTASDKVAHPLVARRLAVTDVADLGSDLRRVTLDGPALAGLTALGVTDHVKLFVPGRPGDAVVLPRVVDGVWLDKRDPALTYREMTVRTHAPGGPLVLEMVAGDHGPASRWAAQARVGQEVGVLGPKSSALRPLDRRRYVLAVDATGLPAVRNWLDRLPASAQVTVLAEVSGPDAEVPLPGRAAVDVTWLRPSADGTLAGVVERLLGVRSGAADAFWWAAGEAAQIRRIRAAVVAADVPRDSWAMTAYWRRGVAHFDHKSPDA